MKIGFIGGGNMASALIGGVLRSGLASRGDVIVSDVQTERLSLLMDKFSVKTTASNKQVLDESDTVILSVKPQNLSQIGAELHGLFSPDRLVISILAGKPRSAIRDALGANLRVARVMPNLPALVGAGISAVAESPEDPEGQHATVAIFETVGKVVTVPENLMDAVTALSGSGPGFVFYLMEAFIEAGRELGFTREAAEQLTAETFMGSCRLLLEGNESPESLRKKVTSPGGTTAAGLASLESNRLKSIVGEALKAATSRAAELSKPQ